MSMLASVKSPGVILAAMIGSVGGFWISLIGLFVLAITHDGVIANQVADSALKLVAAGIAAYSTLTGLHVYVNRPQTGTLTAGATVQTVTPGTVVPVPTPAAPAQPAPGTPPGGAVA